MDPANPLVGVPRGELGRGARARRRHAARRSATRTAARALAGFGSAKGSNEEAYLFQKLVRTGFGTNNVDHCTRLCHASSVAALLEGIGSGAVSNPVMDVMQAEVVLLIGANPVVNHPVAATWIKNAVEARHEADPRRPAPLRARAPRDALPAVQARHRRRAAQRDDAHDRRGRSRRAELHRRPHERLRGARGRTSPATAPRRWRRLRHPRRRRSARSRGCSRPRTASMILWGMGISQHVHGTDNARCLIALSLMTGQVGRPGTGLHPLRGQNNVQGATDAGLIPMMYPDYQRVDNAEAQRALRGAVGRDARPEGRAHGRRDHGRGARGQDPRHVHHGREPGDVRSGRRTTRAQALAKLEMLVVQDIFLTETAYLADVILPASAFPEKTGTFTNTDRTGAARPRRRSTPPGDARQDLWIIVADGEAARPRLALRASARRVRRDAHRRCRRSPASPGSGSSASTRSPIRASTKATRGRASCSPTHFPTATGTGTLRSRRRSFPPPSGPTPRIRSC